MVEPISLQISSYEPLIWVAMSLIFSVAFRFARYRFSAHRKYILDSARWILFPYLGLLLGHLSPRLLGLTEINWLNSLSLGVGLICLTAILILLVQTTTDNPVLPNTLAQSTFASTNSSSLAESIVSAGAEQFHWSFLRGAFWETLLRIGYSAATAAYAGVWIGGLIAMAELVLHKRRAMQRLHTLVVLTVTSTLFYFTHNFWLCWIMHLLVTAMLQQSLITKDSLR